tara:strand:- start:28 stop:525 length:498 start_codon:yes stop_codon:yes gene_type:complete
MDKFTQFANKILYEYGTPIQSVATSAEEMEPTQKHGDIEMQLTKMLGGKDRRSYIRAGKCVMTGEDAGPFRDELSEREYMISGLGQEAQDRIFDAEDNQQKAKHVEDQEINATDLKTLETVKALAGGKAKGGLNPFNQPEKAIQKAYGKMLKKVAKQVNVVAKKI